MVWACASPHTLAGLLCASACVYFTKIDLMHETCYEGYCSSAASATRSEDNWIKERVATYFWFAARWWIIPPVILCKRLTTWQIHQSFIKTQSIHKVPYIAMKCTCQHGCTRPGNKASAAPPQYLAMLDNCSNGSQMRRYLKWLTDIWLHWSRSLVAQG